MAYFDDLENADFCTVYLADEWPLLIADLLRLSPLGTCDIGSTSDPARTIYLDNDSGIVIDLPTAASTGATTDYTLDVGGGTAPFGFLTGEGGDFTIQFDDCSAFDSAAQNRLIIDLGASDVFGAGNELIVQSNYGAGPGNIGFTIGATATDISFTSSISGTGLTNLNFINGSGGAIIFEPDDSNTLGLGVQPSPNAAYVGFGLRDANAVNPTAFVGGKFGVLRSTSAAASKVKLSQAETTVAEVILDEPRINKNGFALTNSAVLLIDSVSSEATNNYALWVGTGLTSLDGDVSCGGSGQSIGFYGTAVTPQATGYTTFTNLLSDRTCNADGTTVEELADILGTLIEDLKLTGIISA